MRYLRSAHPFLTDRAEPQVERQADLYFQALGYRPRMRPGGPLCYERGRRYASLYRPLLRACWTRVCLEIGDRTVRVKHKMEVIGRLFANGDAQVLAAEARGFEAFLEGAGQAWDPAPIDRAFRRAAQSGRRRAAVLVVYTILVALLVYVAVSR